MLEYCGEIQCFLSESEHSRYSIDTVLSSDRSDGKDS